MPLSGDSTVVNMEVQPLSAINQQATDVFYDSLKTKSDRGAVSRLLYDTFLRRPGKDTTARGQIVDETTLYGRYKDKTIRQIEVHRYPIYDADDNWFERAVNKAHILTRKNVIRFDLHFRAGDKVDPSKIISSKRLLLSRSYLSEVEITLTMNELDTTMVDVVVTTSDRLSVAFDGRWSGKGRTMVEVFDESVMGSGGKLSVRTHFNRNSRKYQGNSVEYEVPNIFGSFYKGEFKYGREFYNDLFRVTVWKDFMLPNDYDLGFSFRNDRVEYNQLYNNTTDSIRQKRVEGWAGKSIYIGDFNASVYFTGLYGSVRYRLRPEVGPELNPFFHESDYMYFGVGLFREKFYRANMIYGFGRKEYLPVGFRFEMLGGYSWGEFDEEYYLGARYHRGKLHSWGYLRCGFEVGTFVGKPSGGFRRGTMNIDIRWISNLWAFRRTNMRQFVSFNHMRGWARYTGSEEVLGFTEDYGPQTMSKWITGQNRAVLNSETVVFTPFQPWGFRMAIFTFADVGLIGDDNNMFGNAFFSTLGLGVRFKNERFVFSTIQLRFGVALGKKGFINNDWFDVSTEPRLDRNRFVPDYPRPISYR